MNNKGPVRIAVDEYLASQGRSPIKDVVNYAARHVDAAKAVRHRRKTAANLYAVSLSHEERVGARAIARVTIENAIRSGTLLRHPDGTIESRDSLP